MCKAFLTNELISNLYIYTVKMMIPIKFKKIKKMIRIAISLLIVDSSCVYSAPVPTTNGATNTIYIYETEARNKALLDSTEIQGGMFDFKKIKANRGVYELVLGADANNKTQIILNPDEIDVYIEFQSNKLSGIKTR